MIDKIVDFFMRLFQQMLYKFAQMPSEPEYDVCTTTLGKDELRLALEPIGWGFNDLSLTEKDQLDTLRQLDDIGHQYHLRLIEGKKGEQNIIHIHWEWSWSEFPWMHKHGSSRALYDYEKEDFITLLTAQMARLGIKGEANEIIMPVVRNRGNGRLSLWKLTSRLR